MASLCKGVVVLIGILLLSLPTVHSRCDFDSETIVQPSFDAAYNGREDQCSVHDTSNITLICSDFNFYALDDLYVQKGCGFPGYDYINEIHIKISSTREPAETTNWNNLFLRIPDKIKTVDFSFNQYSHIPLKIFDFHKLQCLNFSHNLFTGWPSSNFPRLSSLQRLDLSNNNLYTFGEQIEWAAEDFEHTEASNPITTVMALVYLNLAYNEISSLRKHLFINFYNLETLDLSHNMISSLDESTFDGLIKIYYLDISHNKIIDLSLAMMRLRTLKELRLDNNEISTISTLNFKGLESLTTLTLNNNKLSVDPELFSAMKLIEELNLSHNEIKTVTKEFFISNEKLTILDLSYNNIDNIEQGAFKNNNRITSFEIQGNKILGSLVKRHLEGLTNVRALNLSNHRLSQIEDFAFFNMNNLLFLNISNNELSTVSKFAYLTLNNLNTLDLSNNILTEITFDTTDLNKLLWISLKNNKITDISPTFTQNLHLLQILDISGNNVVRLPSDTFKSLQNLRHLHIENNPLSGNIEEKTFHNLESLPSLDLSNTNISSLQNNSFSGMKVLRNFNISYSNLSLIEYDAFSNTDSLEVLDASHNRLTVFSVNNSQITHLEKLILSHNLITYIASETLINLHNLKQVSLSNNKITRVENDSFVTLLELQELDLAFNKGVKLNTYSLINVKYLTLSGAVSHFSSDFPNVTGFNLERLTLSYANITDLESLKLSTFTKLEALDLSTNYISQINTKSFQSLPMLEILDLHSNKIEWIQPGSFIKTEEIVHLNLSYNEITTLSHGIFLGLRNLRVLDLSYNKIKQINVHKLYNVPLLEVLIIDGNNINDINFEQFIGTKLATISLGDNPLLCPLLNDYQMKHRLTQIDDTMTDLPVVLTAVSIRHDRENVDGITCKGDPQITSINNVDLSKITLSNFVYNTEITNNLLKELKVILKSAQISSNQTQHLLPNDEQMFQHLSNLTKVLAETIKSSFQSHTQSEDIILKKIEDILNTSRRDLTEMQIRVSNNFSEEIKTILKSLGSTNQTQFSLPSTNNAINKEILKRIGDIIINVSRSDTDIQNKNYNEMKEENSHFNEMMKYLDEDTRLGNGSTARKKLEKGKSSTSNELSTHTSTSTVYVANQTEKFKNELKEFLAHEHNNMINEIKSHLTALDTQQKKDSAKNAEQRKNRDESVYNGNPTSKFTEVCVGIILAIVVGVAVYKIYKAKNVFPKIRSLRSNVSTQEISSAMEL